MAIVHGLLIVRFAIQKVSKLTTSTGVASTKSAEGYDRVIEKNLFHKI